MRRFAGATHDVHLHRCERGRQRVAAILVMAEGGLYESRLRDGRWSPTTKLPGEVNVNGTEIGAVFSPSGDPPLRARHEGPDSGEFFVFREAAENWPPGCPAKPKP